MPDINNLLEGYTIYTCTTYRSKGRKPIGNIMVTYMTDLATLHDAIIYSISLSPRKISFSNQFILNIEKMFASNNIHMLVPSHARPPLSHESLMLREKR